MRLSKPLRALLTAASDRRWPGLRPLEHHIVICGFPRSGSTLLQAWLESAMPHAKVFGTEKGALNAARLFWPGWYPRLVTKRPDDIFLIEEVRQFYAARSTRVSFLVTTRDPRAILVSKHGLSSDYYVSVGRWQQSAAAVDRHAADTDLQLVDYDDLILKPRVTSMQIGAFLGVPLRQTIERVHEVIPAGFDTIALNGVRALDATRIRSWEHPIHAARLAQIITPEVATYLRTHGYLKRAASNA